MSDTEPADAAALRDDPAPRRARGAAVPAAIVRVRAEEAVLPPTCACCGAAASRVQRELRWFDTRGVLVPYCAPCHRHVTIDFSRRFAVAVSSALLSATCVVGLPLLFQPPSLLWLLVWVAAFAALPVVGAALWPRARHVGHAASGRAAFFRPDGALVCLSESWGEELAHRSGVTAARGRVREPVASVGLFAVWAVASLAVPFVYQAFFPIVHVVNASNERLAVFVDGRLRATVAPTFAESALGVVLLRVPVGEHLLAARDLEGRTVDSAAVLVESGMDHLYAPASGGTCFWVQSVGYGRRSGSTSGEEPLEGAVPFWVLDPPVDVWFASPPTGDLDERSSGGLVRALRRGHCDDAPEAVRGPAGARGR